MTNESSVLKSSDEVVYLALFLPLIDSDSTFSFLLEKSLQNKNCWNLSTVFLEGNSINCAHYISGTGLHEDFVKYEVAAMIIKKAGADVVGLKELLIEVNTFENYDNDGSESCEDTESDDEIASEQSFIVFREYDPREVTPLKTEDKLLKLIGQNFYNEFNNQDIVTFAGLHLSLNLKQLLGEEWSYDKSTYNLSYIDDSLAVYQKKVIVDND